MSAAPLVAALSRDDFHARARAELAFVYGEHAPDILQRLEALIDQHQAGTAREPRPLWSEQTQMMITYGDSIIEAEDSVPLEVLERFLREHLEETFSAVHILPFFTWSSDDGFSVIHYRRVSPTVGDWPQVRHLAGRFNLMFDLVINHVSRESLWFIDYLSDTPPGRDYFIELPEQTDVTSVTRPRNTKLLAPVSTRRGMQHVWATFSEDQIDLNFANPDVLIEMVGVLLYYLDQGARLIRLDAIAYLWKELGTSCIHLPQTHAIVRLLRAVMERVAPGALLLTETNVPHLENLSYFGNGDEAHIVYQFTLPPLLLHTLTTNDARALTEWAATLPPLPSGCTYLNFTASHDGVGVRALEGLLAPHDIETLLELMQRFGGFISMKTGPDGQDSPYEINITYFDALKGTRRGADPWQIARFICSQTIMLGLQGIPAVYVHSLLATLNDHEGVTRTGRLRAINRKRWQREALEPLLEAYSTPTHIVFEALTERLKTRRQEPCFHPDAPQKIIDLGPHFFAFLRGPLPDGRRLLAVHNVTDRSHPLNLPEAYARHHWRDLLGRIDPESDAPVLKPYRSCWLISWD
ncbi:sugar phosphorylase [Kushneria indalinina]|uniref:Sucrose phosphorylase n=1 Tax=Kushneria indalinina DSM 14324 TaxID=1122140 RepID=A0A3D9DU65_9GAMM|nr:sugar phosphorylase [Kushneria indalinina]REC94303.1 sucrose phosphorylase [Kushneria indalinina DSM 14324]